MTRVRIVNGQPLVPVLLENGAKAVMVERALGTGATRTVTDDSLDNGPFALAPAELEPSAYKGSGGCATVFSAGNFSANTATKSTWTIGLFAGSDPPGIKEAVLAIGQICEKLERLLLARQGAEEKIASTVDALCRIFQVERNEVAMFSLDTRLDCFSFLWPQQMRNSGSIPFSANRSLVSITAGKRRCFMDNSFATTPHLFVFEAYGKSSAPIQKIMSAPMLHRDELRGVIQVCRKGEETDISLKDFSEPELAALGEIAKVVGCHLSRSVLHDLLSPAR